MSEILQRVAIAISKKEVEIMFGDQSKTPDPWAFARAAIEAMREPTDAMMAAGHGEILEQSALPVWQAMIDEALK